MAPFATKGAKVVEPTLEQLHVRGGATLLGVAILYRPRGTARTLADLADGALLERAFAWLCHRRRDFPFGAAVWTFRRNWSQKKERLQAELREGCFHFGLLPRFP